MEREDFLPLGYEPIDFVGAELVKQRAEQWGREARQAQRDAETQELLDRIYQSLRTPPPPGQGMGFSPEEFARAFGILGADEQLAIYRSAEAAIVPIAITLGQEPKFWGSIDQDERDRWEARARLATAAAAKKDAPTYDKLFPNPEAFRMTNKEILTLFEMPGVKASLSAYVAIIVDNPNLKTALGDRRLVDSFFEIGNLEQFRAVREAMRRDILKNGLGLTDIQAQDAEQVAWNFIYLSNIVEEYDSRFKGRGEDRLSQSVYLLKSLPTWMMMHPQERLEGKVGKRGKPGEAWSAYGEWALHRKESSGGRWTPASEPDLLPQLLLKNAFEIIEDADEVKFMDILLANGRQVLRGIRSEAGLRQPNMGPGMNDTPFSGYYFNHVSPAIQIFDTISDGLPKDKSLKDIGNALRKLRVSRHHREVLLYAIFGMRPDTRYLTFLGEGLTGDYKDGLFRGIQKEAPGYWT